jgi:glutathione S-transferase
MLRDTTAGGDGRMYQLHGSGAGVDEAIVRTVLHEKGLPFVAVTDDPDDLTLVHVDDDERVTGRAAILDHLERAVPDAPLREADGRDADLLATLLDEFAPLARRCRAAVDAGGAPTDDDASALASTLAALAERAPMAPFLAGERFGLADVVWFWILHGLEGIAPGALDLDATAALPGGAAHREAVSARASIQRILAAGDPFAGAP